MIKLVPCLFISVSISSLACFAKKADIEDIDLNQGATQSLDQRRFEHRFEELKRLVGKFQTAADDYVDYLSSHEIEIANYSALKQKHAHLVEIAGQVKSFESAELHCTPSQREEISSAINSQSEKALFLYRQCTGDPRAIAVQREVTKNIDTTRSLQPKPTTNADEIRKFLDGKSNVLHGYDAF